MNKNIEAEVVLPDGSVFVRVPVLANESADLTDKEKVSNAVRNAVENKAFVEFVKNIEGDTPEAELAVLETIYHDVIVPLTEENEEFASKFNSERLKLIKTRTPSIKKKATFIFNLFKGVE